MKKFLFYLFTLGLFSNYAFSSDSIYVARYKVYRSEYGTPYFTD